MARRMLPRRLGHEEEASLVEHLTELRHRLLICIAAIVPAFAIAYAFHERLIQRLKDLLPEGTPLVTLGVTEPFTTSLKVSFYAALSIVLPILLWQVWAFLAPAVGEETQRVLGVFVVFSTLLFVAGLSFCYTIVLPKALEFLRRERGPQRHVRQQRQGVTQAFHRHVQAHRRRIERAGGRQARAQELHRVGDFQGGARAGAFVQHRRGQARGAERAGGIVARSCPHDHVDLDDRHLVRLDEPHRQAVRQRALLDRREIELRRRGERGRPAAIRRLCPHWNAERRDETANTKDAMIAKDTNTIEENSCSSYPSWPSCL